jgi:hypothetical protein
MLGPVGVLDTETRKILRSSSITIQFNFSIFVPFRMLRCTVLGNVRGNQ